jgi:hypothetical protein
MEGAWNSVNVEKEAVRSSRLDRGRFRDQRGRGCLEPAPGLLARRPSKSPWKEQDICPAQCK